MVPIALDPAITNFAVAGNGRIARRRLQALRQAGAARVLLFANAPDAPLRTQAGPWLREYLPPPAELAELHVLWIADLDLADAAALAAQARAQKLLVNVEDQREFCDFHSVAEVRRGNLLLTVSTNGAAPGLAGSIRRRLESCFGSQWGARVDEVAALRAGWRAAGVAMPEAAARIDAIVEERCWLSCPK